MKCFHRWMGFILLTGVLSGLVFVGCTRKTSVAPTMTIFNHDTPTHTPSATMVPTNTPVFSPTPSWTPVHTGTPTRTFTITQTFTPTSTQTPLYTDTPCGYPGNTCTSTFTTTDTPTVTATFTRTHTGTPSATGTATFSRTPTLTWTPTALPAPRGLFGFVDTTTNRPAIVWAKDTNPNITSYKVYMSTDGVTYSLYGTFPLSTFTLPFCTVNDPPAGAAFNRYYYVVSSNSGMPPDSAPSRIVHAVSGAATTNSLSLGVFSGAPAEFRITGGSVPGGVRRVWYVDDMLLNPLWLWGEEAVSLTIVNYGYSNFTGITYQPPATLSSGTTYIFNAFTLNNENWEKDWSYQGFIIP